jgi:hypothetical protein
MSPIISAQAFFFAAAIVLQHGGDVYSDQIYIEPRNGEITIDSCASHGGVGQSLGVGNGAHQSLGVECEDGTSFRVIVR